MPPKVKYPRELILSAALEIAREKGLDAVVTKEVSKRMGTTVAPIYTAFQNIEELQQAVMAAAVEKLREYLNAAVSYSPEFKKAGMQMIRFATEEPKLFQMIFMREKKDPTDLKSLLENLTVDIGPYLDMIQKDYSISRDNAYQLFSQVWLHSYSICVLSATGTCTFSEAEIAQRLGEVFAGMVMLMQSDKMEYCNFEPEKAKPGDPLKGVFCHLNE